MKKFTANQLRKIDAMHGAWVEAGNKLTNWVCPYCFKSSITRQPKKRMVSEKGYWDSARICLYCCGLSFVCVHPNGKTTADKMQ